MKSALLVFSLIPVLSFSQPYPLSIDIVMDKSTYIQDEPIYAEFKIKNSGNTPVPSDPNLMASEYFKIKIEDENGLPIEPMNVHYDSFGISSFKLSPGDSLWFVVDLQELGDKKHLDLAHNGISFFPPGKYTVTATYQNSLFRLIDLLNNEKGSINQAKILAARNHPEDKYISSRSFIVEEPSGSLMNIHSQYLNALRNHNTAIRNHDPYSAYLSLFDFFNNQRSSPFAIKAANLMVLELGYVNYAERMNYPRPDSLFQYYQTINNMGVANMVVYLPKIAQRSESEKNLSRGEWLRAVYNKALTENPNSRASEYILKNKNTNLFISN
ncbi:MAG: hypothetical protein K9N11_07440 [Lentisphaeria bacterium]|nr:hypothetical protein [Candidatus Neomarinimicrobiota bacterium]MCF7842670.1 hypothetical protein [Lentisphaeria bacterium]